MDRKRGNIVVSRRAILEETRAEQRTGLISTLAEGQVIDGIVKNITDYGAFVDLGGIDGLLHVTDMSYKRVNHPSEVDQHRRHGSKSRSFASTAKRSAFQSWHETARESIRGRRRRRSIRSAASSLGACHQHYRIWGIRRAGSWRRGPDPCVGNELDEEERPPGQDRQRPRRRSKWWCSKSTRTSAVFQPWPEAGTAKPVGGVRRSDHPVGSTVDGRGQELDRVRPVHRFGWRRRRHGPHERTSRGALPASRRWRCTARARKSRRSCSKSIPKRSGSGLA